MANKIEVQELSGAGKFIADLRQALGLPPDACLLCGHPVIGWAGVPAIPSHPELKQECLDTPPKCGPSAMANANGVFEKRRK